MKRKIIRGLIFVMGVLALLVILLLIFSPYGSHEGYRGKLVVAEVTINAPVREVYTFLGNSDNAQKWSVFVDHITTLNPEEYKDGQVGSKRRCYQNADETGLMWDEEVLVNEKNTRRRLNIYNMRDFTLPVDHLLTEQIYTVIDSNTTHLAFTLFFEKGKSSWWDEFKMYMGAYRVKRIFKDNLLNIKKMVESKQR